MEDSAAIDQKGIWRVGFFYAEGEVLFQFLEESVSEVATGDVFAFFAEEWGVVDGEEHAHGWFINLDRGEGFGIFGIADAVSDFKGYVLVEIKEDGADFGNIVLVV